MNPIRARFARRAERQIAERSALLSSVGDPATWQLQRFNEVWKSSIRQVPAFASLAERFQNGFRDWEEFRQLVPVTTKQDFQQHLSRWVHPRPSEWHRVTGGSTAQPVRIPAWNSELRHCGDLCWHGRKWFGIDRSHRATLIWGHSHHFGRGVRGLIRRVNRMVGDWLLGYQRVSAYNLSEPALDRMASAISSHRPDWIYGYAGALDRLARHLQRRSWTRSWPNLRVVIATAEGFPLPDSRSCLEAAFGCPVVMEYGSVETYVIAHERTPDHFEVFWDKYLLEIHPDQPGRLLVTCLYDRATPLVRYEIGDEVELFDGDPVFGFRRFRRVLGRTNAYVPLPDGSRLHSELFAHAVRDLAGILAFQLAIKPREIVLRLVHADGALPATQEQEIRRRLEKIHPSLRELRIETRPEINRSNAGKSPMVVREP